MILTSVAERLAVELSQPDRTTSVCLYRGSNSDLPQARRMLFDDSTSAVIRKSVNFKVLIVIFFYGVHLSLFSFIICLESVAVRNRFS